MALARKERLSIVVSKDVQDAEITVTLWQTTTSEAMEAIARRANCKIVRSGRTFIFGHPNSEDRAMLVRQLRFASPGDAQKIMSSLTTTDGKFLITEDGILLSADRVDVLARLAGLIDQLEAARPASILVSLHVVTMSMRVAAAAGFDTAAAARVAAIAGTGGAGHFAANITLDSLITLSRTDKGECSARHYVFITTPGQLEKVADTITFFLPTTQVGQNNNNSTTVQLTPYDAGDKLSVSASPAGDSYYSLDLDIERTAVTSQNGEKTVTGLKTTARPVIPSAKSTLVVQAVTANATTSSEMGMRNRIGKDNGSSLLQVWATVYPVGGFVNHEAPAVNWNPESKVGVFNN